jgi:hypothetical protein
VEWFNAIAGFIEHLLWPAVVLVIVWLFRKPLEKRIAFLLSVETPAGKVTFSEQVEKAAELTFEGQQRDIDAHLADYRAALDAAAGRPGEAPAAIDNTRQHFDDMGLPVPPSLEEFERALQSSEMREAWSEISKLRHPSRLQFNVRRRLTAVGDIATFQAAILNPSPGAARTVWETLHDGAGARWLRRYDRERLPEVANAMVRDGWLDRSDGELIHLLDRIIDEPFRHGSSAPTYMWSRAESEQIIRSAVYLARKLDDIRTREDEELLSADTEQ